jgi:hypothetical protein
MTTDPRKSSKDEQTISPACIKARRLYRGSLRIARLELRSIAMKAKSLCSTFVMAMILAMAPLELSARTLGMVANNATDSVTVFDGDTYAVLGTVPIPPGRAIGDVLITRNLKRGFVTNFDHKVFVVDLTTSPPSLARGTNPIPISNGGEDLSISPDGRFLVVSDGSHDEPISVINIAAQAEISTFSTGDGANSVDVCSDGSVLFASFFFYQTVGRLTLSGAGTLTDTGEILYVPDPVNVYCAPGAKSGVVITSELEGGVSSFTIPLSWVDYRELVESESAMTGAINRAGKRVFARSNPGSIDVFSFDQTTGALGASPRRTFKVAGAPSFLGMDQIALHPKGGKLFVSEPGAVKVYNPSTGASLGAITDPAIVNPTGVTVVTKP